MTIPKSTNWPFITTKTTTINCKFHLGTHSQSREYIENYLMEKFVRFSFFLHFVYDIKYKEITE